jgi:hypothetical protein
MNLLRLHHLQLFAAPAALASACILASCSAAPVPAAQIVQVPVAVSCVQRPPLRPVYEFDQLPATASDGDKILALVRDWARYRKYAGELEAVIEGCK